LGRPRAKRALAAAGGGSTQALPGGVAPASGVGGHAPQSGNRWF
jgi:hypothetical protein